ncbi:hypothetical protein OPQ81_006724 [Rhizoctonia solani]|nr:hypothetical protein OPQ81_006724 [Rhizoctonia solani]
MRVYPAYMHEVPSEDGCLDSTFTSLVILNHTYVISDHDATTFTFAFKASSIRLFTRSRYLSLINILNISILRERNLAHLWETLLNRLPTQQYSNHLPSPQSRQHPSSDGLQA